MKTLFICILVSLWGCVLWAVDLSSIGSQYGSDVIVTQNDEAFSCVLMDKDLALVKDGDNDTWLYTNDLSGSNWIGYARTMDVTTFATGSKTLVKDVDSGMTWACPHLVIKVASDFYLMFYTYFNGSLDGGIRAAKCSTPNGTFTRITGFDLTLGASTRLESDPGIYKESEDSQYITYWILGSKLSVVDPALGFWKVVVDKTNQTVTYGNETTYPNTNLALSGYGIKMGGAPIQVTLNGKYQLYYAGWDGGNAVHIIRALSSDPKFQTVDSVEVFQEPTAGYSVTEKPQSYVDGNYFIMLIDVPIWSIYGEKWATVARRFNIVINNTTSRVTGSLTTGSSWR